MAGYLIVTIKEITDVERIQQYREKAWPTIEKYDGEALITPRSRHDFVEGSPAMGLVVYRFPSYEQAVEWYNSDAYQEAAKIRHGIADLDIVIVEGAG
jgi:uncharacterized protein (DUF1330 family)